MPRLYLVRHGRAAAGWDTDPDPPLDDLGRCQAQRVTDDLAPLGPLAIITSPLLRCRQTAEPLTAAWADLASTAGADEGRAGAGTGTAHAGVEADPVAVVRLRVEPRVAEIPSPEGVAMADRVEWLRAAMQRTWSDLGPRYLAYRDQVVHAVAESTTDTVVFSHFIAINAVIGACIGDDRLVIRSLDNASVTVVDVERNTRPELVTGGHEADTLIR